MLSGPLEGFTNLAVEIEVGAQPLSKVGCKNNAAELNFGLTVEKVVTSDMFANLLSK